MSSKVPHNKMYNGHKKALALGCVLVAVLMLGLVFWSDAPPVTAAKAVTESTVTKPAVTQLAVAESTVTPPPLTPDGNSHQTAESMPTGTPPPAYVPDQLIVMYAAGVTEEQKEQALGSVNITQRKSLSANGTMELVFLPEGRSVVDAQLALSKRPEIQSAEPDQVLHADGIPDDQYFSSLWGLHLASQPFGSMPVTGQADIDAPAAWDMQTGSSDVVVAVIDSGIDYAHEDLVENVWTNPGEIAGNGIDDDANGYIDDIHGIDVVNSDSDPMDDNGHGTFVSGIIAAKGNNGVGVAGVAWNAKVVSCKYLDASGSGSSSNAILCLNYFRDLKLNHGVNIKLSNNSYGGSAYSSAFYSAISAQRDAGILFVASAGNDGTDNDVTPHYPGSYDLDNIITVAAIDKYGALSSFSNYGLTTVDVAAPGSAIGSTWLDNDYYFNRSGTSYAAPYVSGMLVLYASDRLFDSWTALRDRLYATGKPLTSLSGKMTHPQLASLAIPFVDADTDGMHDNWELSYGLNPNNAADAASDMDGDGLINLQEYQARSKPHQIDTDGDAVIDGSDNCVLVINANQLNTDGDAQGNVCDSDDDNDGVVDSYDNCPLASNANQLNSDGDLQGDVCDAAPYAGGAAGTLDVTFNLTGPVYSQPVSALTVQADGKVLTGTNGYVRRYSSGGTLDSGFTISETDRPNSTVFDLAVQPDGNILVGGSFNNRINPRLSRFSSGAARESSFNTAGGPDAVVRKVAVQADGKIIIGGEFDAVDGITHHCIARLNKNGSLDASFNPAWVADVSSVSDIVLLADGRILVGGGRWVNGQIMGMVRRLNADGSLDSAFDNNVLPSNGVIGISLQSDGKIIIGGNFSTVNNVALEGIARLSSNGAIDTGFTPSKRNDGVYYAFNSQPDGKIIAAGIFERIGGVSRRGLARFNSDGSLDTSFQPGSGIGDYSGAYIGELAIQPDGKLLIAGSFNKVNGINQNSVARIHTGDPDGDGIGDAADMFPLNAAESLDTDRDGTGNNADADDDGDGVNDGADNCLLSPNVDQNDTDTDGQGNVCDVDDDNDGVSDSSDNWSLLAAIANDHDHDGFPDNWSGGCDAICQAGSGFVLDNCPLVTNINQLDTDGDAQGNACDTDDDNDGVPDDRDVLPLDPTESADTDGDGTGNNTDTDDDNDGVLDGADNCPLAANTNQADTDADGKGNVCDLSLGTRLDAGMYHTCFVAIPGRAKCWGRNSTGQLGDNTTVGKSRQVAVSGLASNIAAVAAGSAHSCALSTSGGMYCWGHNQLGQLGDGTNVQRNAPVGVMTMENGVIAMAAGNEHTCALTVAGTVKCWGYNYNGQLGIGIGSNSGSLTPVTVTGLSAEIVAITAGYSHTCALSAAGGVWCWGFNDYGQLGDNTTVSHNAPVAVSGLDSGVKAIAAGANHTCAVTIAGNLKCWGLNQSGQLGNNTASQMRIPTAVSGLNGIVASITAGGEHTCALTTTGGMYCWGGNSYGQLGDGSNSNRFAPVPVAGLDSGIAEIAAGFYHTCAIRTGGDVKCWGFNNEGQLGDGTLMTRLTPVDVVVLADSTDADDDDDAIADVNDNCPLNFNPDQLDTDGDTQGNPCDADDDNDGDADVEELLWNMDSLSAYSNSATNGLAVLSFETGLPSGWYKPSAANANWLADSSQSMHLVKGLRSGNVGSYGTAQIQFSDNFAGTYFSFYLKTSTEVNDVFRVYVDGVGKVARSSIADWEFISVPVTPGVHTIKFDYTKNGSGVAGSDAVWIDKLMYVDGTDTDGDGQRDGIDTDDDNDGLPDGMDPLPLQSKFNLNAPYKGSQVRDQNAVQ